MCTNAHRMVNTPTEHERRRKKYTEKIETKNKNKHYKQPGEWEMEARGLKKKINEEKNGIC